MKKQNSNQRLSPNLSYARLSLNLSKFLFIACISIFSYSPTFTAIANAENSQQSPTSTVSIKSKKQLARELLVELGIGKQYDLSFWNMVDFAYGTGTRTKFSEWLQQMLAQSAGWKYVEPQYVASLEANFSEMELMELLDLAKRPLMKKLVRSQIQAYEETGEKRARLIFKVWEDYNSGKINIPPNLLK
ncbi:hypothetical protein H6F42_03485 [Pseudanabaena sp. FACHB-1998]|uniref:hypothetical protein n=1 Tax=Pseudanabaena sp. FACHB-1998 TaxID=2692858 RepID=UPI00168159A3|nr:hypothetical protein [Pseudanabaena sp. FACHB-1998]MBD2175982.1 hypothetical protein [Pseudanabaena sp. FACHB-1998]